MNNFGENIDTLKGRIFHARVEENKDPMKRGRIKARVEYAFGTKDDVPTEDLPWCLQFNKGMGKQYEVPQINKIVQVSFIEGDPHKPVYYHAFHYNINLQNKLDELEGEDYTKFAALYFNEDLQIYRDNQKGYIQDYVNSNIKIDNSGNISLNLRDNKQYLRVGTEDSNCPAMLGNHWLDWFDEFVQALQQVPYMGNLGIPVILGPSMAQVLARYSALRPTFKSDHVFITDNQMIKGLTRPAVDQEGDKIKSSIEEVNIVARDISHSPVLRDESRNNSVNAPNLPPDESSLMIDAEDDRDENFLKESAKADSPDTSDQTQFTGTAESLDKLTVGGNTNLAYESRGSKLVEGTYGCKNVDKLKKSRFLSINLSGGKPHLQPEATDSFDAMMEAYEKADFPYKQRIIFTSAFRCSNRGTHAKGLAVDMFWGVRTAIFYSGKYDNFLPIAFRHPVYMWFIENSYKFGWEQPTWANNGTFNPPNNRRFGDVEEWWHWEYMGYNKGYVINAPGTGQRVFSQLADKYKVPFDPVEDVKKLRSTGQLTYFDTKKPSRVFS